MNSDPAWLLITPLPFMKQVLFFLRTMIRESRGSRSRLFFFGACIAIGVSVIVGVAALIDTLEYGVKQEARNLLGADMVLSSRRAIPEHDQWLTDQFKPFDRTQVISMPTMARSRSGRSQLISLKSVDGIYPLRGKMNMTGIKPASGVIDPTAAQSILTERNVLVAPDFLETFDVQIGDEIDVGVASFTITGVAEDATATIGFSFSMGPKLYMSREALEKTQLLGFGHRVKYETHYRFSNRIATRQLRKLQQALKDNLPGGGEFLEIQIHTDAQPALRRSMERIEKFLGLMALLSLLLGSVGVSQIIRSWLAQKTMDTAVLRCLGVRPVQILQLYLSNIILLAVVGSLAGGLIGLCMPVAVSLAQPEFVPPEMIRFWQPWALMRGVGLGVMVAILFSLPPLLTIWRVSPIMVLRSDVKALPLPKWIYLLTACVILGGLFLFAYIQSENMKLALGFTLGLLTVSLLLWFSAGLLIWCISRMPRSRLPLIVRQGLAALARPGSGVAGSLTALGVGVLVVMLVSLVQHRLGDELNTALPENAANLYIWDIQKDQWAEMAPYLKANGANSTRAVPVVTGRIKSIDGIQVQDLIERKRKRREKERGADDKANQNNVERAGRNGGGGRGRMFLLREQRITWMEELSPDNEILEGALWSDPEHAEVSLDEGFAESIGAKVGSDIVFDIQGISMPFKVTSIREIEWRSFNINFFITAEPGILDKAPHIFLGAVNVPEDEEAKLQDALSQKYPNVVVLRVRDIMAKAADIVNQILLAIRLLGGFTIVTGLVILIASVAATQMQRAKEAALLKTMGARRTVIMRMFALEYAIIGLLAGTIGIVGAYLLAMGFLNVGLDIEKLPSWRICLYGIGLTMLLTVFSGLSASFKAILVKPLTVLRSRL